uniref:Uncharacterized protein n=1 Tax=Ciona intestinalis TaxID=7719 RepID=F6PSQ1_CIOIN
MNQKTNLIQRTASHGMMRDDVVRHLLHLTIHETEEEAVIVMIGDRNVIVDHGHDHQTVTHDVIHHHVINDVTGITHVHGAETEGAETFNCRNYCFYITFLMAYTKFVLQIWSFYPDFTARSFVFIFLF